MGLIHNSLFQTSFRPTPPGQVLTDRCLQPHHSVQLYKANLADSWWLLSDPGYVPRENEVNPQRRSHPQYVHEHNELLSPESLLSNELLNKTHHFTAT